MKRPAWFGSGLAAALILMALGLLVATAAAIGLIGLLVGPQRLTDAMVLERYVSTSLPGFEQARVLAREPGTTATYRRLRFEVAVALPDGSQRICQGLLVYHQRPAPTADLAWDDPACAEAVAVVRLARQILAGGSLRHSPALYGEARTRQAERLLRHWLATGRLRLQDIPGADNRRLLSE
ncbi:MAG: hypothetical protein RMN24_00415 [Anaerolineae bacterium]|nr:hypothetical protein [Caldilineales bacterium]MCX7854046.1 hypothetical protein [Caldilineales bacterium]MDW8267601.1 hypothetical protein [Anaerolineae bacterium]